MEVNHMSYGHMGQYSIGSQPYCTASANRSDQAVTSQYYPENQVSTWNTSIHPFHENINWASYGLPNPGAKCPPMSAHGYAIARRNERERTRVSHINSTFEKLRRHLPNSANKKRKLSKVDTLKMAVKYINHLQQVLDTSEDGNTENSSLKAKIIVDNNTILTAVEIKQERCCSPTSEEDSNSRLSLTEGDACGGHMISPGSDYYKVRDSVSPVNVADESEQVDTKRNNRYHSAGVLKVKNSSCSTVNVTALTSSSGRESHEDMYTPCFLGGVNTDTILNRPGIVYGNQSSYLHHLNEAQSSAPETKSCCQYSNHGFPSTDLSRTSSLRRDQSHVTERRNLKETLSSEVFANSLF